MILQTETGGTLIEGFYEQRASYGTTVKTVMITVFLLILASYLFSVYGLFGFGTDPEEGRVLLIVLFILLFAIWSFFGMKFRLGSDSVVLFSAPFTYRIPFSEISSVGLMEEIPWYTGWGLRIHGRKLLFVGKHGRAVFITKETGFFRAIVFVPENPDEFVRRIEIARAQFLKR